MDNTTRILMLTADQLQLDRRIIHEAFSLAKNGISVDIYSLSFGMSKPVNLPDNVHLIDIGIPQKENLINFIKEFSRKHLPRTWQELIFFGFMDPAGTLTKGYISTFVEKWDVIIAHDLPLLPLALEIRTKQGGGRVILDAHELYDEQLDFLKTKTARKYWRDIEDKHLPCCDGIMTVTDRLAQELQKRHGLPSMPVVLRNSCPFVDSISDKSFLHCLFNIPENRKIVLCQGGLAPGRSLEEFVAAWGYMPIPRPALVFLGFGRPDYVKKLNNMIQRLGLEDDVLLGRAVAPDEVLSYTCGASLGLISNRGQGINNTDGGPNRLFEYIQARVPILSYEHNGVRQVLDQTGTGWVVKWESPEHLAQLIQQKLIEAEHISQEKFENAARKFSWENEEQKLFDLIMKVRGV